MAQGARGKNGALDEDGLTLEAKQGMIVCCSLSYVIFGAVHILCHLRHPVDIDIGRDI